LSSFDVAGDRPTPETDVDVGLLGRDGTLDVQGGHVDRRRQAVQRHVDDRGDPTGGGRPGRGREALPLGAARLVDVHVRVDHAGQQHLVVPQGHGARGRRLGVERPDRGDAAAGHRDAGRLLAGGQNRAT